MYRSKRQENKRVLSNRKDMGSLRCKLLRGLWTVVPLAWVFLGSLGPVSTAAAGGTVFANRAEVVRIIQEDSFNVINHVKDIPRADLVSAGVIRAKDGLKSFVVDPGEEFQSSDSWVDVGKPARQLIVGAINAKYELLSFWKATQGGPARYLMLVRRAGPDSRVIFYATLDGEVRGWLDLKRLVSQGKMTPLISAEHPHAYRD